MVKNAVIILTALALSTAITGCTLTPNADQSVPDVSMITKGYGSALSNGRGLVLKPGKELN